jgi:hypothetical protein
VCDLAYVIQAERIERTVLAQTALAPYVEKGHTLPTVESARREFDAWLSAPVKRTDDQTEFRELMGLSRGD